MSKPGWGARIAHDGTPEGTELLARYWEAFAYLREDPRVEDTPIPDWRGDPAGGRGAESRHASFVRDDTGTD